MFVIPLLSVAGGVLNSYFFVLYVWGDFERFKNIENINSSLCLLYLNYLLQEEFQTVIFLCFMFGKILRDSRILKTSIPLCVYYQTSIIYYRRSFKQFSK